MPRSLVVLVQPQAFFANEATQQDNYFQAASAAENTTLDGAKALQELKELHQALVARGVEVCRVVWDDAASRGKPDAIFPNNTFSLHCSAGAEPAAPRWDWVLYPMSPGRVEEIPAALEAAVRAVAPVSVWDYRDAAPPQPDLPFVALEGTGALVFAQAQDAVFMSRSLRGNEPTLRHLLASPCPAFSALKEAFVFGAVDSLGRPVYHTNVVGWCGTTVAAWCLEAMRFGEEGEAAEGSGAIPVRHSKAAFFGYFAARGVEVLGLSFAEMDAFCGNALELFDGQGRPFLTISGTAWAGLSQEHRAALGRHYDAQGGIHVAPVPTIEALGGGSVRCLQAHCTIPDGADPARCFAELSRASAPSA